MEPDEAHVVAKEAARRGREQQLNVYQAFEAGERVTFKVHYKESGYPLSKTEVPARGRSHQRVKFDRRDEMFDAATQGKVESVRKLLEADPALANATNFDRHTPLHRACIENHMPVATALINAGANVNAADNDWWTPLHYAAQEGSWRLVSQLVNNGADVTAVNCDGDLPIDVAEADRVLDLIKTEMDRLEVSEKGSELRARHHVELRRAVQAAIDGGADLNARQPPQGATFLHMAACNGFGDVVRMLCQQKGINVNARDDEGNTPFHLAVFFQEYETVLQLAMFGADIYARNNLRQKPVVLTEDPTMLRLVMALEKKIKPPKDNLPKQHGRRGGSVRHRSTKQAHDKAHKDMSGEARATGGAVHAHDSD